ncbi:MAG: outer membrane protein assembly factor BamD [Rhodospirillaceae bacterium]|nr:outer membrane protein assembly factor BamD [Rhodospirillaceae bacterium]
MRRKRTLVPVTPVALAASIGMVLALLAGCATGDEEAYVERSVEELYNEAMDSLLADDLAAAVAGFLEVERQHPYSVWATRSQIMSAFVYYQGNRYDEAIAAAERFVELHPGHRDAAYGYYLIAISHYEQISDVGRDQKTTALALQALDEVARRFPDSVYARDARLKIDLARDHLAGKEMTVGRYYLRRGNPVAAIGRFRMVVEQYQTTSHTPEALHRLTEAYLALGVPNEAQTSAAVLGHNYPGNRWYQHSYALLVDSELEPEVDEGSWISRVFGDVF